MTIRRTRIRWPRVAGLLAVVASIAAALGHESAGPTSSTASTPPPASPDLVVRRERPVHEVPGLANLDPALRRAVRRAAARAAAEGVELVVESGRRSPERQRQLLDEAVAKYGSQAEAARWVATPDTSPHVKGDAVDVGPSEAAAWLSERGAAYGLCQIYANEPWHFELRAADRGCPPQYPDPTHDPRMR